jgi:outer membrane lipoprotein-sorting protein
MKKFFILALILAFVSGAAYAAEETFKVGGQYRMEMYDNDDKDFDSDADDHAQYIDQRFRIKMDFMPADGVKAVWQADFAETAWGTLEKADSANDSSGIGYRPNVGQRYNDTIMVDKAYVDITKAMVNAKVGLYGHGGFGNGITTDNQAANIMLTADFSPVQVIGLYTKVDEGTSFVDDTDLDATEDQDIYGLEVKYAAEAFGAGAFYATWQDQVSDAVANVIGVYGSMNLGKLALWGEVDMFSGDDGGNIDYVGTNVTIAGEMPINEKIKAGFNVHYAPGTDADDEEQITNLTDDAAYIPFDFGPFQWIEGIDADPHNVEANSGETSFDVYGSFGVMQDLTLYGLVGYILPSEEDPDGDGNYIESQMILTVAGTYYILPGTSFSLQYTNVSRSVGGNYSDDPAQRIMGLFKVNF